MFPSRLVLVIGDDRSLCAQLTEAGFEVSAAPSVEIGLRRAYDQPPGLIVVDLGRAGAAAAPALRRLSNEPATCRAPLIALTAPPDEAVGRCGACDVVLLKPVDTDELLAHALRLTRPGGLAGRIPTLAAVAGG
jgi:DNA-binding response OmpR family regulator